MSFKKSLQQIFPRRWDIPCLILLSAVMFVLGLSLPLMNVEKMFFWKNEYSVINGIMGLFHDKEYFLAAVLFFFSIIFPTIKLFALWILWQFQFDRDSRTRFLEWMSFFGKWSMLDVFVVAILIVAVKLGPLANVEPRQGVYVFCLAIVLTIFTTASMEKLAKAV